MPVFNTIMIYVTHWDSRSSVFDNKYTLMNKMFRNMSALNEEIEVPRQFNNNDNESLFAIDRFINDKLLLPIIKNKSRVLYCYFALKLSKFA